MDATFTEVIDKKGHGLYLFDHLKNRFPYLEPACWQAFIADPRVCIDGIVTTENPPLIRGQQLRYSICNYSEPAVDTRWQLLWQNDEIVALHKPALLPVSRTTRNIYNNLIELVRRQSPWPDAHLLHRLDLETAGVILLGKNKAAATHWQPKLKQLLQRKIYRAIVYGIPAWQTLDFECCLAPRKESPIRCKMYCGDEGKESQSRFKVLAHQGEYSLVECELITGRKHQIRAHLAELGHPIVGDKIYANNGEFYLKRLEDAVTEHDKQQLQTPHHLLFAQEVTLDLSDNPSLPPQVISNCHYPDAWVLFCTENNLTLPA